MEYPDNTRVSSELSSMVIRYVCMCVFFLDFRISEFIIINKITLVPIKNNN